MSKPTEQEFPVTPVLVIGRCEACGDGQMLPTGKVLFIDPPRHEHRCNLCGHEAGYNLRYPFIRHYDEQGNVVG